MARRFTSDVNNKILVLAAGKTDEWFPATFGVEKRRVMVVLGNSQQGFLEPNIKKAVLALKNELPELNLDYHTHTIVVQRSGNEPSANTYSSKAELHAVNQNQTIPTQLSGNPNFAEHTNPVGSRFKSAIVLMGIASLVGIGTLVTFLYIAFAGQLVTSVPTIPEGEVSCDLLVSRDSEPATTFLNAETPLRPGDGIQILVESAIPTYCYAYWLDANGNVERFWPGKVLASKKEIQRLDKPRNRLTIPDLDSDAQFLTLKNDTSGVHAIVVLIRTTPLTDDVKINLTALPQPTTSRAEFDSIALIATHDEIIRANNRSPIRDGDQHRVDDPVRHLERITTSQANGIAGFTRAFLFSFEGQ